MVRLVLHGSLPFVTVRITHRGRSREVPDVLVDTGSSSTVIAAEVMGRMSVLPEAGDRLRTLRGIGGRELVFTRQVDNFEVGGHGLPLFEVEIGAMDYRFPTIGAERPVELPSPLRELSHEQHGVGTPGR